ncbi:cell division control protein 6 [Halogranum amylolyticum]|uniref:ORC1-type DNA replication protein n=1 Tax=Halogranum amylolyticum TaxID=660520 RepID=A0A1H8N8Q2_9EURY|nr:orc1/cdc6 family replication initiation protein [Halogranum amylolyticum]SEO25975.1 cell division control protein 6 [Halogranum amylolyticum]
MGDISNYFEGVTTVFRNKDLLQIDHVPDNERLIIGRESQLNALATGLQPAVEGQKPNNVLIYGKTGTGKSLCSKFMARQLVSAASENDVSVGVAYVDCFQDSTESQVIRSLGSTINDQEVTDETFPASGVSTSECYKRAWRVMDELYDVVVVVLDELDKMDDPNSALMNLSRAAEAEKIQSCKLGIIGISNKPRFKDRLNERARSSLCQRDFVFPPYDADQIEQILEARDGAFKDDVLEPGVIPRAAALAAREHGDARKAIDILRTAGEMAQEEQAETVREGHVDAAQVQTERDHLIEVLAEQPPHSRYVLKSVALLDQRMSDDRAVKSSDVNQLYRQICTEQYSSDPLSWRRVRDLLHELEFLEIIERKRKGAGRGEGGYMETHLLDAPEIVIDACDAIESDAH